MPLATPGLRRRRGRAGGVRSASLCCERRGTAVPSSFPAVRQDGEAPGVRRG